MKADRELSTSKILNAPIDLVWKVFTQPEHIKQWWGPNGFTNTISKMEVKQGGQWIFIMHGPDGTDYKNKHTYKEIAEQEKIVLQHETSPKFITTLSFEALRNKTLLKWHALFESAEQLEQVIKVFKADEGMKQNVERLSVYLEKMQPENQTMVNAPFSIERTFDAPVPEVWKAITDRDSMKQWYFTISEFKPVHGYEFKFAGEGEKGKRYIHLCKVTEVSPEKKLAYTWKYESFEGNSIVTFDLFAEGNKTRLKLTHDGLETFPANNSDFRKESFAEGWTMLIGTSLKNFVEKK